MSKKVTDLTTKRVEKQLEEMREEVAALRRDLLSLQTAFIARFADGGVQTQSVQQPTRESPKQPTRESPKQKAPSRIVPDVTVLSAGPGGYGLSKETAEGVAAYASVIPKIWCHEGDVSAYDEGGLRLPYSVLWYRPYGLNDVRIVGNGPKSLRIIKDGEAHYIFRNAIWVIKRGDEVVKGYDDEIDRIQKGDVVSLGISPYMAQQKLSSEVDPKEYQVPLEEADNG